MKCKNIDADTLRELGGCREPEMLGTGSDQLSDLTAELLR